MRQRMMRRVAVVISGRVQGVFFRAFVQEQAIKLGVHGFVRNGEDGTIEAVFEGHEAKIKPLLEACQKGPPGAMVEKIVVTDEPFKGEFQTFRIRY